MRVTRLEVRNYRSLEEAEVKFDQRVTLLVGRNNSGKSNVIDALSLIHALTSGGELSGVSERGGFQNIVFGHDMTRRVRLAVDLDGVPNGEVIAALTKDGVPTKSAGRLPESSVWRLRYTLDFTAEAFEEALDLFLGTQSFVLVKGSLDNGMYSMEVADFPAEVESLVSTGQFLRRLTRHNATTSAGLSPGFRVLAAPNKHQGFFVARLNEALRALILRVGPNRNPSPTAQISGASALRDDGSNFADWVHSIRSNDERRFQELVEEFVRLVPEVIRLSTPLQGGPSTTVMISESSFPGVAGFDLSSSSFGERNLFVMLGHLVAGRPAVVLSIEEPETCLHPQAQRLLAQTLWRYGERQQILASTHSPVMCSGFPLEALQLVFRENGRSRVESVTPGTAPLLVAELGVRPGDIFDQDAIVLVEGETDEKVFALWYDTLRRSGAGRNLLQGRVLFLGVRGLTNIPFYLDARILQARTVPPDIFVVTDGDVKDSPAKEKQWRIVRERISVPP